MFYVGLDFKSFLSVRIYNKTKLYKETDKLSDNR